MLSNRWIKSKYSDNIYHARIPNHKDPARDIVLELERDSSGAVWPTVRFAGETFEANQGDSLPDFERGATSALKRVMQIFQARRNAALVCEFVPLRTDWEWAKFYGTSQSTANAWRRQKTPLARRSVNQITASLGFKFSGRGKTENVELRQPTWED